jgi:WD40 repeat protein
MMDHQNIAKVFDAGTTDTGRPYFVMELVQGVPITQFCDTNQLTPRERLRLFVPVCQAIQHAHQKGIIHRDIKPSNVLITMYDDKPVPKVIDFGVAKAIEQRLTEKTLFTQFGVLVGTFEYMSPEQADLNAFGVDTRCDIYSLGVLLYELLTGTTPLERERLRTAALSELVRLLKEEEPPRPSVRLSSSNALSKIAAARKTEPAKLSKLVRGELDWIAMKCLEKDRSRRYETASGLTRDIERYLHDEPVEACPPSVAYRVRKFARRNKAALITASFVALAALLAVAGLATSTVLVWQANSGLSEALEREQKLRKEERQNSYYERVALADREWSANNLDRMEQLLKECPEDLRGWEWHFLKRLPHKTFPPVHHESMVLKVAFSPTGECFASSSLDGIVKIWDARTGQLVHTLKAHNDRVFGLVFSPDGKRLASVGAENDRQIHIWDVRTGQRLLTWEGHEGRIASVAFSPNGQLLATAGAIPIESEVKIWDAVTGELLHPPLPGGPFVVFSPDGQRLAEGASKGEIRIWDTRTYQVLVRLPEDGTSSIAFSPDGRYLATTKGNWWTEANGEVTIWDSRTGEKCRTLHGHTGFVLSLAYSPDGRRIASVGMDRTVKLWDVATGRVALTLRGPGDFIRSVAFSPDGWRVLAACEDRKVWTWDATPLEEQAARDASTLRGHSGAIFGLDFHPDGRRLATASADATVRIWDFRSGKGEITLPGRGPLWSVAFRPDGRRLAAVGGQDYVGLWDAASGKELSPIPAPISVGLGTAFSPDGRFLACVGWDRSVWVWDATTGAVLHNIRDAHAYTIYSLAISPDSRYIASAAVDNKVKIWDAATGQAVTTLEPTHEGRPTCVRFCPVGHLVASAAADGSIKLWDTQSWKLRQERRDPTAGVQCLAFSPDGRWLAWGSTDATVKVWEVTTEEIRTLRGHTSWVKCVAFSPDGQRIASGSLDGTVRLWTTDRWSGPRNE